MSSERVLRDYFHAKDENRPHLLQGVFASDACLEIRNPSAEIHFPSVTHGIEAIADVLVRRFNQTYENIYSFYMARPSADTPEFSCDWLVGMSEKASKSIRVGCGGYEWTFRSGTTCVATHLVITINRMLTLPPETAADVGKWLLGLPYPWASVADTREVPFPAVLKPVVAYLGRETR
jgi:hypothetical protein